MTCPPDIGPGIMLKSHWSAVTQVVKNKGVGDAGFEPVTSTVCKTHKKRKKRKK
jgi:hypothetical protein